MIAALGSVAFESSALAANRGCGQIRVAHAYYAVRIERGNVGCPAARRALRMLFELRGTRHGGPYAYEEWWSVGAWRCGFAAGSGTCNRGGARVTAIWRAWECGHQPGGPTTPCRRAAARLR